jgi:5'-nucleotidase
MRKLVLCLALGVALTSSAEPPARRLRVLVTNDDGVEAAGLQLLATELARVADVTIVAPAGNESGTSHSMASRSPLAVERIVREDAITCYSVAAKPALVVRAGLDALLAERPDLVVSGVNHGVNLGTVAFVSGTVAAAREAAIRGVPAIAASSDSSSRGNLAAAARLLRTLVEDLRARDLLRPGLLLNVNVPDDAASGVRGRKVTRLSLEPRVLRFEKLFDDGATSHWRLVTPGPGPDEEGTDVHAVASGWLSVTPMTFDQTATAAMGSLRTALEAPTAPAPATARP